MSVEFTVVVDLCSLAMDEQALARGLSHISTRSLALDAVSTLKVKLPSYNVRECIAGYIASPLVETVAVEKTYRVTTSRRALDDCFFAHSTSVRGAF